MRYVALLRGINVGGHKKLPMADLRAMASGLGYDDVATYIQSGNLFLDSDDSAEAIEHKVHDAIAERFGYDVSIIVRSAADVDATIAASPYAAIADDEKHLHIGFLSARPKPEQIALLEPKCKPGEEFTVIDRSIHLLLPHGTAVSKLMTFDFARHLGVAVTVRNWRTVQALVSNLGAP